MIPLPNMPGALAAVLVVALATASSQAARADSADGLTYADLADLADGATVVARAQVRSVVPLKPGQGLPGTAGAARVYVEARTRALLVGSGLGESMRYLADLPPDSRGRLPSWRKREVLIFARTVPGRPTELQLTAPDAQLAWSPVLEQRTRALLTEMIAPGAAPRVRAVREATHVPGNLTGEGETQIFLATDSGAPVSLTVLRRPGRAPAWGVSLSEIVDQAAAPPPRETLTWYRLACFLPQELPEAAILAGSPGERATAREDYRLVRTQLGTCPRNRRPAVRP